MFDYKLLQALSSVINEGGFEKAALKLHLTQSAVSQRIKQLEEFCGQILLVRSSPPMPTETGKALIAHFNQVVLLENNLLEQSSFSSPEEMRTIKIAINNDSLATWFPEAVDAFLRSERILLHIEVDDQEQTQNLLHEGKVFCSISTCDRPINGCSMKKLGKMLYGMYSTIEFRKNWFSTGFSADTARNAPSIRFNAKDQLNSLFFSACFKDSDIQPPSFFVPSSEKFTEWIKRGYCFGAAPVQQCRKYLETSELVDLQPEIKVEVPLFYHCWNLNSSLLQRFSTSLLTHAQSFLD